MADIGNLRDHYLMVAMLRLRAEESNSLMKCTYFTRRLKSAATAALFNQSVEELIYNFRRPAQPNLNWDAVKMVFRTAGALVLDKPPRWRKPWMSDST